MDALGSELARWAVGLVALVTLARWIHLLLTRPEYILGGDESDPPRFVPRLRRAARPSGVADREPGGGHRDRRRPRREAVVTSGGRPGDTDEVPIVEVEWLGRSDQ